MQVKTKFSVLSKHCGWYYSDRSPEAHWFSNFSVVNDHLESLFNRNLQDSLSGD